MAFQFALEDGDVHFVLKAGFDPEFRVMSPGRLTIHASLARMFAIGLKRFDLLGTADAYKLCFATDVYDRLLFQAFSRKPAGRALHAAFAYGRPLAQRASRGTERLRQRVGPRGNSAGQPRHKPAATGTHG